MITNKRYHSGMKHNQLPLALWSEIDNPIVTLRCRDTFSLDPDPLNVLFASTSEHDAKQIICTALEDITDSLERLQAARRSAKLHDIPASIKQLTTLALKIGLSEVCIAANHVAQAAEMGCQTATGATLARLERTFDASLDYICD